MMYTPLSTLLKKALFALSMLIPLLSATFPIQAGAPMQPAGMPGMPADPSQMTPEQIAEWERQLDQEIQAFVKTLPPEQQEQFHKDVEELTKVMEKMSEDELMEFVGSVLSENQTPATQPMPKPQPKPAPAPTTQPKKEPVAPKKPTATNRELEARALIESIIHHMGKLVKKINSDPALAANIQDWGKAQEIEGWQAQTTWPQFKAELEKFEHMCTKLIEQDKTTQAYLHLPTLIDEEHVSLYNSLQRMNNLLAREIPDIIIPEFGLQKMSIESKRALKKAVSACAEAFYILKLPASIEAVFKKYEPTAQKIKESEDKKRQTALEASKRTPPKVPVRSAGVPKEQQQRGRASRPSMSGASRGSSGGGYRGTPSSSSYHQPRYQESPYGGSAGTAARPSAGGGSRGGQPASPDAKVGRTDKNTEQDTEGATSGLPKSGKETVAGSSASAPQEKVDRKLARAQDAFTDAIDNLKDFIKKNQGGLHKAKPLGDLANAAFDALRGVSSRINDLKGEQKSSAIAEVNSTFDAVKSTLINTSNVIAQTPHLTSDPTAMYIKQAIDLLQKGVSNVAGTLHPRVTPSATAPSGDIPPAPPIPTGGIPEKKRVIDVKGFDELVIE